MNPYEILGVARNATAAAIKAAYRRLSRQHHPDRGGDGEVMAQVNQAYEILSSPERRERWERTGSANGPTRTLEDEARDILMSLAHQHFENAPEDVTLIVSIRTNVEQMIRDLPKDRQKVEKRRQRYLHFRTKYRGPPGRDFLANLIDQQLLDIDRAVERLEHHAKVLETALGLLNDFTDVMHQQPLFQIGTGTGSFSWTRA